MIEEENVVTNKPHQRYVLSPTLSLIQTYIIMRL